MKKVFCRECECLRVIDNKNGEFGKFDSSKGWRECHKRSPGWGVDANGDAMCHAWPRVRNDDWCFEGQPVPRVAEVSND